MTKITNFVWNPVDDCIISELDGTGAVQAVYTNEPQQYGGVISQRRGTTTSTYHADALGSTRFLTDSSGNVTDTYLNDAWGNNVAATGTTVNPFKWVGKCGYYTDTSTAQVYVRARIYQPAVARWLSIDPIWFPDGSNAYLYVQGNPNLYTDPSGLFACKHSSSPCGTLNRITLVENDSIPSEVSVNLVAQWTGGRDCNPLPCRCREVGFVQTVEYDYVYGNKNGFGLHYKKEWHLDTGRWGTGWPYSYPDTIGSSEVDPLGNRLLSMTDSPGVARTHSLGHRLLSLEHNFETCVTCLTIQYPHFDDGSDVALHTLGCFKWSYVYIYDPSAAPPAESLTRYLTVGGTSQHTSLKKKQLQVLNAVGDAPSEKWQSTVCEAIQSFARYGPGDPD